MIVRRARAIRPCRPITLPMSSSATCSRRTSEPSSPSACSTRTASGSSTSRRANSASNSSISAPLAGDALDLQQAANRLGRLRAVLEPLPRLVLVDLDEGRLVLRVVAPDDLDELAVAGGARVGGHDAIDRILLRADPGQAELHCHLITSLLSSFACFRTCGWRSGGASRSAAPAWCLKRRGDWASFPSPSP